MATNPDSVSIVSGTTFQLSWNTGEMNTGQTITITVTGVRDAAGNDIGTPNDATAAAVPSAKNPAAAAALHASIDSAIEIRIPL